MTKTNATPNVNETHPWCDMHAHKAEKSTSHSTVFTKVNMVQCVGAHLFSILFGQRNDAGGGRNILEEWDYACRSLHIICLLKMTPHHRHLLKISQVSILCFMFQVGLKKSWMWSQHCYLKQCGLTNNSVISLISTLPVCTVGISGFWWLGCVWMSVHSADASHKYLFPHAEDDQIKIGKKTSELYCWDCMKEKKSNACCILGKSLLSCRVNIPLR